MVKTGNGKAKFTLIKKRNLVSLRFFVEFRNESGWSLYVLNNTVWNTELGIYS